MTGPVVQSNLVAVWDKLNADHRYPEVQFGPTEPNGELLWRVSLVNPADVEVFAETLSLALFRAAGDAARRHRR